MMVIDRPAAPMSVWSRVWGCVGGSVEAIMRSLRILPPVHSSLLRTIHPSIHRSFWRRKKKREREGRESPPELFGTDFESCPIRSGFDLVRVSIWIPKWMDVYLFRNLPSTHKTNFFPMNHSQRITLKLLSSTFIFLAPERSLQTARLARGVGRHEPT